MDTITAFLGQDHHRCDDLFVGAERAAGARDMAAAQAALTAFVSAMEHHFAMEESDLFPAFEQATGQDGGPTFVMRHEHAQMRQLFAEMAEALAASRVDDFLGAAETLLILMQQHNRKEEQILYPMSDRLLDGAAVVERMKSLPA